MSNKPMSDEELACMRQKWAVWMAGSATRSDGTDSMHDELRLLAEVERLRAENTALREIVEDIRPGIRISRQTHAQERL